MKSQVTSTLGRIGLKKEYAMEDIPCDSNKHSLKTGILLSNLTVDVSQFTLDLKVNYSLRDNLYDD
jgi:hypothetical protein